MKSLSFLVLTLSLLVLVGCNPKEAETANTGRDWSPLSCDQSAEGCTTQWNFSFKRDGFPTNVAVLINGIKVIDECSPDGSWFPSVEADKVKFRKDNYSSIRKEQKISLQVMNLGEPCGTLNKEFIYHEKQEFKVNDDPRDLFVIIEA